MKRKITFGLLLLYGLTSYLILGEYLRAQAEMVQGSRVPGTWLTAVPTAIFTLTGAMWLPEVLHVIRQRSSRRLMRAIVCHALYLLWSAVSLCWSVDVSLGVRQVLASIAVSVGAVGLGLGFLSAVDSRLNSYGRSLCVLAVVVPGLYLLLHRDSYGLQSLIDPTYIFPAGIYTKAVMELSVLGVIAALYVFKRRGPAFFLTLLIPVFFLALLKSRGMLLLMAFSIGVGYVRSQATIKEKSMAVVFRRMAVVALVFATLSVLLVGAVTGESVLSRRGLTPAQSMNIRVRLWQELLPLVMEAPLQGHGIPGIWTQDVVAGMSSSLGTLLPAAHSGYVDEVLTTGLVGLFLLAVFWVTATSAAARILLTGRTRIAMFSITIVVLIVTFNLVDSVFQGSTRVIYTTGLTVAYFALGSDARFRRVRVARPLTHSMMRTVSVDIDKSTVRTS